MAAAGGTCTQSICVHACLMVHGSWSATNLLAIWSYMARGAHVSGNRSERMLAVNARVTCTQPICVTTLTRKQAHPFLSRATRLSGNIVAFSLSCTKAGKKRVNQRERLAHCNIHGTCVSLALFISSRIYIMYTCMLTLHLHVRTHARR